MTDDKIALRKHIDQGIAELRTMRDEIRVKLHLAGLEAKDAWHKLEPRIQKVEAEAKDLRDDVIESVKRAVDDVREAAQKLREDLRSSSS